MQFVRDAVVEAAFVVDDVAYHPRGGAAAHNQRQVVLQRSPTVPKIAQCPHESRPLRVHRRQFIEEHDATAFQRDFLFQIKFQNPESLHPCLGFFGQFAAIFLHGVNESLHLLLLGAVEYARHGKGHLSIEQLVDEISLADPSATINSNKFRTLGTGIFLQQFYLMFATYQFFHNILYSNRMQRK